VHRGIGLQLPQRISDVLEGSDDGRAILSLGLCQCRFGGLLLVIERCCEIECSWSV
jgi:hypothetical protein